MPAAISIVARQRRHLSSSASASPPACPRRLRRGLPPPFLRPLPAARPSSWSWASTYVHTSHRSLLPKLVPTWPHRQGRHQIAALPDSMEWSLYNSCFIPYVMGRRASGIYLIHVPSKSFKLRPGSTDWTATPGCWRTPSAWPSSVCC
jgi:hypothetical protein